ncbi:disease resistance protein RGA2-like [Lolium rigidum]|uniref:disease resistance protein RGA2-like n=1 Tax=Lolium rigidum TaxID=89674 RepID=UPI001F5C3945|nr:disease resistance protein RGA2-like [Lolium rigidum]
METAVGAASWLVGKVLNKMSDELVAAYLASSELGLNADQIKEDLMYTHALLHAAQGRDDNPGLKWLLEQLSGKADDAEDALDELHYFMIQDQLDGTQHATPDMGGDLQEKVQHGRNAVRHTIGNWLQCFSCSPTQDDDFSATATAVIETLPTTIKSESDGCNGSGHADKLTFDRVAMSIKIKSVIEGIHSKCIPVSDLLKIPSTTNTTHTTDAPKRPITGSMVRDKLYGRSAIFEQTIKDITSGTYHGQTLSVLPIVGPGGIGKTTFTQHLYNDKTTMDHFSARVWVCVSTDFDVLKLTQQIRSCIPPTEEEKRNNTSGEINNLDKLQISIADRLKSKRFLIVLDDIWKCDSDVEWNTLLAPFTRGESKGSMVIVTTRFPKIGKLVSKATDPINLQGLDPKEFLEFFEACIFDENKDAQEYNELIDIGREIAKKLKCSPLAAKTVAPLLKSNLSWEHWMKVLENNEWQNQTDRDDIMPALKISYHYLPFHLKRCFSYFSLFPEDTLFKNLDIICFWNAIGIMASSTKNKNYVEELVDNGFLMQKDGQHFVMHDLLHELSRNVSSQECTNISSLSFSADDIPRSIRHLSVTIEDRYDENFSREMVKLKSRIDIGKLRTLMIFREYDKRITEILMSTFNEIEGLRVLFIVMMSSESLPKNFSKLLHLRYLRLIPIYRSKLSLPGTLPRFYHLLFLDLEGWLRHTTLPKYFSRLVNLRHFIANPELHSNVPEVGKIEHLEELKDFHVKKESVGFELEELGNLSNLGGELRVCNLERVSTKEEASKANLALKRNLKKLVLVWGREQLGADDDVVDGLQPHYSLRELGIEDHGGATGTPSWLYRDIAITHLESLTLEGVSWVTLPPFGQLQYLKTLVLKDIARVRHIGPDSDTGTNQCFRHLKEVEIADMPVLETWTLEPTCYLFPVLERIECSNCPSLLALPFFKDSSISSSQVIHYPCLRSLKIIECPELLLPPMPPAPSLTYIKVDGYAAMKLKENHLTLTGYSGALAFHNMGNIVNLESFMGSITSWTDLQKATSLRELSILGSSSPMAFSSNLTTLTSLSLLNCENIAVDGSNSLIASVNLKKLVVANDVDHPRSVTVDLFAEVARRSKQLPAGSFQLGKLTVDSMSAVLVAPVCSLLAATLNTLGIFWDQRVESLTEDEEKSLQMLTSLQSLKFESCQGLPSLPRGLRSLSSLRKLKVEACPEIQSLPKGGLPSSLYEIIVSECSTEIHEQARKLKATNPELRVFAY